jgi:hypothetical protein
MPTYTSFLELTLPELNEFLNNWNKPLNENLEELDDFLSELHENLVGTGTGSRWADLRGGLTNLAARLDVSINADGTLDISNSPDILNMSTSAVTGDFGNPRDRLNAGDFLIHDARQPFVGGRFVPVPTVGPTAGFPPEKIDSGVAFRTADFGAKTGLPIASPQVPWAPGLVTGGANPLITGLGIGQVRISGDTPPAVFNIDGYVFRLREIIDLDWSLLAPGNGVYVWLFVDRNEGSYNNANYKYTAPGGGVAATKDLRKLQSGSDGITSGSTFSSASALFNTKPFGKVREGDTIVVTTTAAAGSYVVDQLDGTTPDVKFTIKGEFKGNVSGAAWYVLDNAHPNIGAVATDVNPTTLPPFVAGRVYIGRAAHNTGGAPTNIVTFHAGGVYDSGWVAVDAATDFPYTFTHNLGVLPADVQIWCRVNASAAEMYQPLVKRSVVTDAAGPTSANFFFPSMQARSSELGIVLRLLNASTVPLVAQAIFTDSTDTDKTACEIRVIARR